MMLLYATHDLLLHLLLCHQGLRRQHAFRETLRRKTQTAFVVVVVVFY